MNVIVESEFYIYMLNDYCLFSLWTEVVATIVHGEQKSLMDSNRCYNALILSHFSSFHINTDAYKTLLSTRIQTLPIQGSKESCSVFEPIPITCIMHLKFTA